MSDLSEFAVIYEIDRIFNSIKKEAKPVISYKEKVITQKIHSLYFDNNNLNEIWNAIQLVKKELYKAGNDRVQYDDFFQIYSAAPGEGVTIRWEE